MKLLDSKASQREVIEAVNALLELADPNLAAEKRQRLAEEQHRSASVAGHPSGQGLAFAYPEAEDAPPSR
jgi:hypothetical protein